MALDPLAFEHIGALIGSEGVDDAGDVMDLVVFLQHTVRTYHRNMVDTRAIGRVYAVEYGKILLGKLF